MPNLSSSPPEFAPTPTGARAGTEDGVWPLWFGLPVFVFVLAYQVGSPRFHSDDLPWLEAVRDGLLGGLTSSDPYGHYRPTFHAWLWTLDALGLSTPTGLGLVGLVLEVGLVVLCYRLFRHFASPRTAAIGSVIVAMHPIRQDHWFWVCTQIDLLSLTLGVAALLLAVRAYRRRSLAALVGLAVTTMLSALAKETALLVPLVVLMLPVAEVPRVRRLAAFVASCLGGLAAVVATVVALRGIGGHTSNILSHPDFVRLIRFFVRMMAPFDWGAFWFRFQSTPSLTPWWYPVVIGLSGIAALVYLGLAWRTRHHALTKLSLLLACWAGAIWLVHEPDRSLGIAAVGLGALVASALGGASSRLVFGALLVILVAWTPRWLHAGATWRATDVYSANLEASLSEWREQTAPNRHLVALATAYEIDHIGQPQRVFELDPCASRVLMLYHAPSVEPSAQMTSLERERIRLSTKPPTTLGACHAPAQIDGVMREALPPGVTAERVCDALGGLESVEVDLGALRRSAIAASTHCSDPLVLRWNGARLVSD